MARTVIEAGTSDTSALLERLKSRIGTELHAYPYPIAGCDEVFKTRVAQKEWCRIALAGLANMDGITDGDVRGAIAALLASPLELTPMERTTLGAAPRSVSSPATPA